MCCEMHGKEPSALFEKEKGFALVSRFYWLHIAPQHLVNHYMVLCIGIGLKLEAPQYLRKMLSVEAP